MPLRRLSILIAALWWGGITGLSFVAVPSLFASCCYPWIFATHRTAPNW